MNIQSTKDLDGTHATATLTGDDVYRLTQSLESRIVDMLAHKFMEKYGEELIQQVDVSSVKPRLNEKVLDWALDNSIKEKSNE